MGQTHSKRCKNKLRHGPCPYKTPTHENPSYKKSGLPTVIIVKARHSVLWKHGKLHCGRDLSVGSGRMCLPGPERRRGISGWFKAQVGW